MAGSIPVAPFPKGKEKENKDMKHYSLELIEKANACRISTLKFLSSCGYRFVIEDGRITDILGEGDEICETSESI